MLHALIMAGGAGTRFWPASRAGQPKQLLNLVGDRTLLQGTLDRLANLVPVEQTMILTNRAIVQPVREQLPELPASSVVGEPCKRDTAPCIGLAAALFERQDPDATMLVMPADHVIQPIEQFQKAVQYGLQLVEQLPERLVTFGIRPSYPAETFGYIQRGERLAAASAQVSGPAAYGVRSFREKPKADLARQYLESGEYYWNAGIFIWKARTIREALRQFEPEMAAHLEAIAETAGSPDYPRVLDERFAAIRGKSIDYAVMEHYKEVVVVEAPFEWDDLGNWQSLARLRGTDEQGNTLVGRHLGINTSGTIVRTDGQHLVVTVGLKDCIVVHTPDATLVANRHDEEAIREVVKLLEQRGWTEYL